MGRKSSPEAIKKRGKNGRSATGKQRLRSLDDLDKRTAATQSILRTRERILRDLGGDPSAMALEVVNSVCVLSAMLQDAGSAYLRGEPIDLLGYGTLANAQRRLLADLGLHRVARDISSKDRLRSYIAATAEPVAA